MNWDDRRCVCGHTTSAHGVSLDGTQPCGRCDCTRLVYSPREVQNAETLSRLQMLRAGVLHALVLCEIGSTGEIAEVLRTALNATGGER